MPFRRKTIVIVEDEKDTAEMFAEMIRLNGFQVINAYSGAQAISQIASNKPDLVVMDLMIPDVPGLDVIQQMQRDPSLKRIPVIIVSARSMLADLRAGISAGAVNYLTKPVAYAELIAAISRALEVKSAPLG